MIAAASSWLRRRYPLLHSLLKRLASPLLTEDPMISAPKRVGGHLFWTQPRLLMSPTPEEHVVRWISAALKKGGAFFDVGAHYGWISMVAARCVGQKGRIVSFEPSPLLFKILRYHKRVNRLNQMQVV